MDPADALMGKFAGVAGAMFSFMFIKGTYPEKLTMVAGGAFLSYYGSGYAVQKTGLPDGLCGFLVGLFGMAVCAKVWEAIQETSIKALVGRWFNR